jgi:hypothetical protein
LDGEIADMPEMSSGDGEVVNASRGSIDESGEMTIDRFSGESGASSQNDPEYTFPDFGSAEGVVDAASWTAAASTAAIINSSLCCSNKVVNAAVSASLVVTCAGGSGGASS